MVFPAWRARRLMMEAALAGRNVTLAVQSEQKGTAHAVSQAAPALAGYVGAVLILYADTPFVEAATVGRMLDRLGADDAPGVVVLASQPADPAAYVAIVPRLRRPRTGAAGASVPIRSP